MFAFGVVDVATTAHVLQRRIVGLRATRTFWYRIVSTHQTASLASLSFDDAATEADGHALCNNEQKIPTRKSLCGGLDTSQPACATTSQPALGRLWSFFNCLNRTHPLLHSAIHSHIVGSSQLSIKRGTGYVGRLTREQKKHDKNNKAPCLRGKVAGLEGFSFLSNVPTPSHQVPARREGAYHVERTA